MKIVLLFRWMYIIVNKVNLLKFCKEKVSKKSNVYM